MLCGSIGAILQKKIKKLIAFSTIAFIGYYLSAFITFNLIVVEDAIYYLFIYIINLIGIFIFILNTTFNKNTIINKLNDVNLISKSNNFLSIIFAILLFAISGLPPALGFFGKTEFYSYMLSEYNILYLIISACFTLISFFYYIRIIKNIYFNTSRY
jgi:NADH-quinone oxidoreductase subunit N